MEYKRKLPDNVSLKDLPEIDNIAELLDEECLKALGAKVVAGYDEDEQSREKWIERYSRDLKLALQVYEEKSHPFPNASNVKFPAMTLAAITFHARAYPSLVPSKGLVNTKSIGFDPFGFKRRRAERVAMHMNYQFLDQMEEWEEDMDRLLFILSITGTEFKKVFYSNSLERNVSRHVFAKDLVVNYHAKSLEKAERKTEILAFSLNEIREGVNSGIYLEHDFQESAPREDKTTEVSDKIQGTTAPEDKHNDGPRMVLEQHTFCDLDGDGYKEPYIITVDYESEKVLRIVARFQNNEDSLVIRDDKVIKIVPDEYYVKYTFIPSIDGGFYDVGFGTLIGPLNEAINTLINMLIDSGKLSNMQSGFISKHLKLKSGQLSFKLGEWKQVNVAGQDFKNAIYPLPVREPSGVLFSLLGLLIDVTQKVTSTTDILTGENPGQNQKATTTLQVVENGMRVFTAIYKRLRRSLSKEILKVYKLNGKYLDANEYFTVIDPDGAFPVSAKIMQKDYNSEDMDILPTADPSAVSQFQKVIRAEALLPMIQLGAPRRAVMKRYYDALEIENPDEVLPPPDEMTPPSPEAVETQHDMQMEEADLVLRSREQQRKEVETVHKVRQADVKLKLDADKNAASTLIDSMESANKAIADMEKAESDK